MEEAARTLRRVSAYILDAVRTPIGKIGGALAGPVTGFDTWTGESGPSLELEGHTPAGWTDALTSRGHRVGRRPAYDTGFGHAHAIVLDHDGVLSGAADPRTKIGSVAGR